MLSSLCIDESDIIFLSSPLSHDWQIASLVTSDSDRLNAVYNPKNKWSCPVCTYLNWPKAIKCTQCQRKRSPSPSDLANGTNSVVNSPASNGLSSIVNENTTFPLTTFTSWKSSSGNSRHLTNETASNAPIAHHRSISNSPSHGGNNANHCALSDAAGRVHGNVSNVSDHNKNLNYKNSNSNGTRNKLSNSRHEAVRNSTKSPPAMAIAMANPHRSSDDHSFAQHAARSARPAVADVYINQNYNSSSSLGPNGNESPTIKWPCAACTYENWPQSTKCVMCYTPRIAASAVIVDDDVSYNERVSHSLNQNLIQYENYGSGQVLADDGEYVDDAAIDDDIEDDFAIGSSSNYMQPTSGFVSRSTSSVAIDSNKNESVLATRVTPSNSANTLVTTVDFVSTRIAQLNLQPQNEQNLLVDSTRGTGSSVDANVTSPSNQELFSGDLPLSPSTAATAPINALSTSKTMQTANSRK